MDKPLFFIAILVLLVGCVSRTPDLAPTSGEHLEYQLQGKVAVRIGDKGHSARFRWQQSYERYEVEVWGPLGQGRTFLRGNGQMMVITQGDKLLAQGAPGEVMEAHLGFSLPMTVMTRWLQGRPYTNAPPHAEENASRNTITSRQDDQGRWLYFEEQGWQVSLDRYIADERQPRRIVASKQADALDMPPNSSSNSLQTSQNAKIHKITVIIR